VSDITDAFAKSKVPNLIVVLHKGDKGRRGQVCARLSTWLADGWHPLTLKGEALSDCSRQLLSIRLVVSVISLCFQSSGRVKHMVHIVRDAGLIATAQKIEHYEIASYGAARDWALILGLSEHAALLEKTLEEEKHADHLLTVISRRENPEAATVVA
jgi:hypothetical protein